MILKFEIYQKQSTLPIFNEVESYARDELIPDMHTVSKETGINWETLADYPGMNTPEDHSLIPWLSDLVNTKDKPGESKLRNRRRAFPMCRYPNFGLWPRKYRTSAQAG